jgi:predicted O-methyltransferase YrrM
MSEKLWNDVERYFTGLLLPADPALEAARAASNEGDLPAIEVAPTHGKLLMLLAQLQGARRVLEIGTLGGYSTIWLARALPPGGRVITIEADRKHADVARTNFARAGVAEIVDLRLGRALDVLPQIVAENAGPFDFFFIDADKENNAAYLDWALKLARRGSLIVVDNVVRDGKVIDAKTGDSFVQGIRRFNERLAAEPRVSATAIQTVGSKGYDGFALALVTSDP